VGNVLVSVTVMAYNFERVIGPCLDSIIEQKTNFNFEILVGVDASSDDTRGVINAYFEKYPKLIKPIFWEKNVGAKINHRELITRAKGKYIAHMDGDDLMLPGNKLISWKAIQIVRS